MKDFISGVVLGLVILLPGMSGGTVLLIFGFYEELLKDLSKLRFFKYRYVFIGGVLGVLAGGRLFAFLFRSHREFTMAVLMGALLASIKSVLANVPKLNRKFALLFAIGLCVGVLSVQEPLSASTLREIGPVTLFVAGALSSAAMIIPGLPGSSVLILMGVYEEIIFYVSAVRIDKLVAYGIGALVGMLFLVKLLAVLYDKWRSELSYLFSGIIIGSARILMPSAVTFEAVGGFLLAFALTWFLSTEKSA